MIVVAVVCCGAVLTVRWVVDVIVVAVVVVAVV